MNKSELITQVALDADVSRASTTHVLDAALATIAAALKAGDRVSLVGFGTFEAVLRPGKTTRNPKTGRVMVVPDTMSPKFRPGKVLKGALKVPPS